MAPDEAQQNAPRRRGRPPGSRNKTTRARRTRGGGAGDLVGQLNAMVAELIKKNRSLQRDVARLTERASRTPAGTTVERGLRTISRRVQKALDGGTQRRRKAAASGSGRRRKATPTRKRRAG
jgi:hypothetical protein